MQGSKMNTDFVCVICEYFYLLCICATKPVMWLVASVCIRMYVCMYVFQQKYRLFSALLLKNLLLCVTCWLHFKIKCLQCGLLHPASCTDRVIHAFPSRTWRFHWHWNTFFWALLAHHTLLVRLAAVDARDHWSGTGCVLQQVFQIFSSCAMTTTHCYLYMYALDEILGRLSFSEQVS